MTLGPVELFEVGPRDGLQNEAREIPVAEKVALVDCLSRAGFSRIEVASFVSPKWVPQMAGSAQVLAGMLGKLSPRFHLMGEAVWAAHRLEASAKVNSVHVDETVQRILFGFS